MKRLLFLIVPVSILLSCGTKNERESVSINQEINYDSLKVVLDDIYVKDQTFRAALGSLNKKYERGSANLKFYWSVIERQDSLNMVTVLSIINKYGWLGKSKIGRNANQAIFLVIQHGKLEIQEQLIPLLKESVDKGESSGDDYGLMVDRILVRNGKEQEYGTQIKYNSEAGKYELLPVRDQKNVDKRRIELGMGSIDVYLEPYGISLEGND